MVNISECEKATLCDRARLLFAKPIKFFNEMRELFLGSNTDGSLAMDQNTCMDAGDGSDNMQLLITHLSSSTSQVSRKRTRAKNSPTKKPKNKSHFADPTEEITATMKSLRETLVVTAPPQMPQLTDPHAALWQRLEAIPMTSD
uniref:Uncharacterized protein n=1 Tax=Setaria italica TaxID=4555 RepID=K4AJC9_SETIT